MWKQALSLYGDYAPIIGATDLHKVKSLQRTGRGYKPYKSKNFVATRLYVDKHQHNFNCNAYEELLKRKKAICPICFCPICPADILFAIAQCA